MLLSLSKEIAPSLCCDKKYHKKCQKWNVSTTITKKIQFVMIPHGK